MLLYTWGNDGIPMRLAGRQIVKKFRQRWSTNHDATARSVTHLRWIEYETMSDDKVRKSPWNTNLWNVEGLWRFCWVFFFFWLPLSTPYTACHRGNKFWLSSDRKCAARCPGTLRRFYSKVFPAHMWVSSARQRGAVHTSIYVRRLRHQQSTRLCLFWYSEYHVTCCMIFCSCFCAFTFRCVLLCVYLCKSVQRSAFFHIFTIMLVLTFKMLHHIQKNPHSRKSMTNQISRPFQYII